MGRTFVGQHTNDLKSSLRAPGNLDERVMVRMNAKMKKLLEGVAAETGARSIGDVIRNAIFVYLWIFHQARDGKKIVIEPQRDDEGSLILPALVLRAEGTLQSEGGEA